MIRRHVDNQFFLIAQNDHAALSGQLARHVGNDRFSPLSSSAIRAIALHDCGWPLHDDNPTINSKGLPIDVFESTQEIALKVWTASADRAQAVDPYVGLLVSIHVLNLSAYATGPAPFKHEKFDISQITAKFALNKFQHKEIERQENLRKQIGLRVDIPLRLGVAQQTGLDAKEDQLLFDFRLLQSMDLISLGACCTEPPGQRSGDVYQRPGGPSAHLEIRRINDIDLSISPWPFDQPKLQFEIAYRPVPAGPYPNNNALQETYSQSNSQSLSVSLTNG